MGSRAVVTKPVESRPGLEERIADSEAWTAAIQASVEEAIERHRLLGESIVGELDGRVIEIPADQIEPLASKRARRAAESQ